jgi:metal-responsive CopG/Arc/MetJ family transcriptional regulator
MARVKLFLKDSLLDRVKREARLEGTNHGALIRTALEKYIEGKRRERKDEEKQKKMQEASLRMDALAKKVGEVGPAVDRSEVSR